MYAGLVMECDYREGRTQEEAFAEAFSIAELAEDNGLDGVWLAERHFAGPRRPTDPMGAGIPSIASVPLVLASAIAARTTRLRIGTGVSVLPLCIPFASPKRLPPWIRLAAGVLTSALGAAASPGPMPATASLIMRAGSVSRNPSKSFSKPGTTSVSHTPGPILAATI